MNKQKNIIIGVSSAFLLLAGFNGWPYDFFVLLRFIVCISGIYLAWLAYKTKQEKWIWMYGVIAVLFNPFFSLHFSRGTWVTVDIATAIFLIASGFLFKLKENKEIKEDADADLYEPAFLYGSSLIGIKRDPKEEDPKYKDIIEQASIEAEKIVTQRNPGMVIGKCIMVWAEQTKILKEKHNIDWKSPAKLNKNTRFD